MGSDGARPERRSLLFGLAALGVAACRRERLASASSAQPEPLPSAPASARLPAEERTWSFDATPVGRMSVVVLLPERRPTQRFPVLIAMHGRGETLKGPKRGARGWVDDYEIGKAIQRLHRPPLTVDDFRGFVLSERLRTINQALGETPYGGLVLVCPYTPDVLGRDDPFAGAPPLASFLVETLIPRVARETPAIGTPRSIGIDGVSLGGRAALAVGMLRPEAFGAVGSLQAAIDAENAPDLAARAARAARKNPALSLRLVTSTQDYYLPALRAADAALRRAGVHHDFLVAQGPHDYVFNRGPGAFEMLLFHDRALRGKQPI